jgi:hypothetical protein
MHNLKVFQSQNEEWHEEHAEWTKETLHWQQQTRRLIAILYQLERALPEHSLTLTRHVAMVKEHQRLVEGYESELDKEFEPKYPDSHSKDKLEKMHLILCKMHDKTERDHKRLSADYAKSLAEFRALAQKLLD